jgi:hypothetical protein
MLPLFLLLFTPPGITTSEWEIQRDFTLAVAEKMPAKEYDFQATPEEMGFGRMMVHIANSIAFRFEQISGEKARLITDPPYDKPTVLKFVRESFDYVIRVLPKIPENKLAASYDVNLEVRK